MSEGIKKERVNHIGVAKGLLVVFIFAVFFTVFGMEWIISSVTFAIKVGLQWALVISTLLLLVICLGISFFLNKKPFCYCLGKF